MRTNEEPFDVVVVGGGPGGSTVATLVARAGHRVLQLEKERLPIYKIGESLLPSTIHGVCAMLGVGEELRAANFVRKSGGTFRWGTSKEPWAFDFSSSTQFAAPTAYAYQVERMVFDRILLDNARRSGVDVREDHGVVDVLTDGDRVTGVRATHEGGELLAHARYVVDASGHSSCIARHAGTRVYSDRFRNLAVFGYFRGGKRMAPPRSGNIFCAAFDKGWFWYIPLRDDLTSVGAVIGQEHASLLHAPDKAEVLADLIAACQPVRDLLSDAHRVTDGPYGQVRVRKDFSYCHTSFWRPGIVLVGDAACFIDPVFSSGVHLATYSGLLAARSINTCLANGARGADRVDEVRAFAEFQQRYTREYRLFHDFLLAFYDVTQDLNGYYWAARKVLKSTEAGGEAFIQLVGGAGSLEGSLRGGADAEVPLDGLAGELFPMASADQEPVPAGARTRVAVGAEPAMRDRFMAALTAEGTLMQMQANRIPYPHVPLVENGLVPSSDGLRWIVPALLT